MKPQDDQQSGQVGAPRIDQNRHNRGVTPPARDHSATHDAAANVIRGQLDNIYSDSNTKFIADQTAAASHTSPHTTTSVAPHTVAPQQTTTQAQSLTPALNNAEQQPLNHGLRTAPPENLTQIQPTQDLSPYQRTMSTSLTPQQEAVQKQWQQYHGAWQKYYQQYYERYYISSVYSQKQAEQAEAVKSAQQISQAPQSTLPSGTTSITQQDALQELRQSIRLKVASSADKVKKSRHFVPAIAGISVLLVFMFLQYNRVIFGTVAAYVSPGNIEPQNIIIDPTVNVEVGPEPRMIIPKINVDAPVVYGIGPDHNSQMTAMESGIAHFSIPGANAMPGQIGNTVMAAHSSNDVFARGDYKFVFAQNEKLTVGDIIHMNYEGKRYTYSVTVTEVVLPTEVSKIQLDTDKPMLTLISCVPLGTAEKRLLIFAEQVSPDPNQAVAAAENETAPESDGAIPGQPSPSIIERLFGAN